jgi:uncharacterized damage-inducible protein DinB
MVNVAEMTVAQFQARQIEKAAKMMCHFVESTHEDRLRWCPATEDASKARCVMDLIGECVEANRRILCYLTGQEAPPRPTTFDDFETVADATTALNESAQALADEVRKLEGDALMQIVKTHRGEMPAALAMQFPLRNMTYHIGQINMIQLLYGDTVFHIDEEFTTL